jgi:murein DD-endopeptidase MepM/ murein hydrolase activator NlpD
MSTDTGRFISKDIWQGDYSSPMSYNAWLYVYANPINYLDPSGRCADEDGDNICDVFPPYPTRPKVYFLGDIVSREEVDWVHWYGGTVSAKNDGHLYNYDGYCQGYHCGIDIGAPWKTPVRAGISGKVSSVEPSTGGGKVFIRKGDYQILYQHLTDIKVVTNQSISYDTIIAGVGNLTTVETDGNWHIHLEVSYSSSGCGDYKDRYTNPLKIINADYRNALFNVARKQAAIDNVTYDNNAISNDPLDQPDIIRGGSSLWP